MAVGARQRNILVSALRYGGPLTRNDLTRHTGLPVGTVSAVIAQLADRGIVQRAGQDPSTGGRPQQRWGLRADAGFSLGVSMTLEEVSVTLVDYAGTVRQTVSVAAKSPATPVDAAKAAAEAATRLWSLGKVPPSLRLGAGIALPGVYEPGRGVVFLPNLPGWTGSDPLATFRDLLELPVRMENDANAGGYAERCQGAARGTDSFLYLLIQDGTGSSLMLDGRPVRGVIGAAGEIGHVPVGGHLRCNCGLIGCLETEASGMALRRHLDSGLSESEGLAQIAQPLGSATAGLVNLVAPQSVVVGGWVVEKYPDLTFQIANEARRHTIPLLAGHVRFAPALMGHRAPAIGAALLVLDEGTESGPVYGGAGAPAVTLAPEPTRMLSHAALLGTLEGS